MEDRERFAGGVSPRGCPEGRSELHAECLIEGLEPCVDVLVRVQQPVARQVLDVKGEPVDHLIVAGTRYASREEAVEHEVHVASLPGRTARIEPAGERRAELLEAGAAVAALAWRWEPLHATIEAWVEEIADGLHRVQVNVANRLEWEDGEPRQSLMRSFYSTEVIMHSPDGAFASLTEPPPHLCEISGICQNEGLWPIPIGEAGDRRTMLASQIPLQDYPNVVPPAAPIPFARGNRSGGHPTAGVPHAA